MSHQPIRLGHHFAVAFCALCLLPGVFSACPESPEASTTPSWDGFTGGCVPDCYLKQCGNDGCGGSCGTCEGLLTCSPSFQCVLGSGPKDTSDGDEGNATTPDVQPDAGAQPETSQPELPPPSGSDEDDDGVDDNLDNCPTVYNPTQSDLDGDYIGDTCDSDIDDDGYINDLDCEPTQSNINPGRNEFCDGFDNNCDGITDGEDSADCTDYFVDNDQDGAGDSSQKRCLCTPEAPHVTVIAGDCDDTTPALSPLAIEICDDVDNDCNLLVDDGCDDDNDGYCDDDMAIVGTPAICPLGGNDCYDYSAAVYPGAEEIEGDDVDNDCDGEKAGETLGGPIEQPDCTGLCTGQSQAAILCALELCYGPDVFKSFQALSPTGDNISTAYQAVTHFGSTSNDLTPFGGTSYVLLATGPATGTSHSTDLSGGTSGVDPFDGNSETNDEVELRFVLKAPEGATGFSVDYIFFSEEYEEFIGSSFNDKFYIFLEAPSVNGGQKTIINYTDCSSPSTYYDFIDDVGNPQCYIAINTAFSEACPYAPTDISGTGFECALPSAFDSSSTGSSTGWLFTSWPIQSGEQFTLTFHIHDVADGIYDSEVILDNFRWEGGTVVKGTSSYN